MSVELLLKRESVVRYQVRLAALLDEQKYDEFVAEFTEDGAYRLIGRENHERGLPTCIIDDTRDRLIYRSQLISRQWHHGSFRETRMLSNFDVEFPAAEAAHAKANFAVYHTDAEGESRLHMVGRLEDSLVMREKRWRVRRRFAILETFKPREVIVYPP
jgi:3-phenylpropionate/cinnamic acid dioxygenase small subunit